MNWREMLDNTPLNPKDPMSKEIIDLTADNLKLRHRIIEYKKNVNKLNRELATLEAKIKALKTEED
jgi:septal ring factor EnvC (AmiA/AmiB activator)